MMNHPKGKHVIVDCYCAPRDVCFDDATMLNAMIWAATDAGATVINTSRYRFGHNSPDGYTCMVQLDESHISAHTYGSESLLALDIFTCGSTDPMEIWERLKETLGLDNGVTVIRMQVIDRFIRA